MLAILLMRTLSPWLHKRASAFGSDKGIIFSSNFWLHTARLMFMKSLVCLTVTALMPPGHVLRIWRSILQALGHINRSSAWPRGAGDPKIVSEENPPKEKVKEWNLTRVDNRIEEDIYCSPIFKTFKEIWRKSWWRRRGLGSQWLVLLVTFLSSCRT